MYFDYTQYVRGCLVLPLCITLFALHGFLPAIPQFVTAIRQKNLTWRRGMDLVLVLLVCGFFLCMNVGRLLHGGIHLIYEREADAIELQGEISEIRGLGRFSFPELESEYGYGETNGVQFTIDGIECSAIVQGSLEVGDQVTVVYLPKSGYILSITESETS